MLQSPPTLESPSDPLTPNDAAFWLAIVTSCTSHVDTATTAPTRRTRAVVVPGRRLVQNDTCEKRVDGFTPAPPANCRRPQSFHLCPHPARNSSVRLVYLSDGDGGIYVIQDSVIQRHLTALHVQVSSTIVLNRRPASATQVSELAIHQTLYYRRDLNTTLFLPTTRLLNQIFGRLYSFDLLLLFLLVYWWSDRYY